MTPRVLAGITAVSGAMVVVLSQMTWLLSVSRHRATTYRNSFDGVDVEALTGVGDGNLVAALGIIVVLASILTIVVSNWRRAIAPLISTSGFLIAGVALYDSFQVRRGSKYFPDSLFLGEVYNVDAGLALWLTLGLGIIIALTGTTLLLLPRAARGLAIKETIIRALEMLQNKTDTNPPKKHGNIPL